MDLHPSNLDELRELKEKAINGIEFAKYRYKVVKSAISIGITQKSVHKIAIFLDIADNNWVTFL